jgi:hypothetical protein
MAKEQLWKLHHIYKENGKLLLDELTNCSDEFAAATELLSYKECDLNRQYPTETFRHSNNQGVTESWHFECDWYTRDVTIYPVEVEKREEGHNNER